MRYPACEASFDGGSDRRGDHPGRHPSAWRTTPPPRSRYILCAVWRPGSDVSGGFAGSGVARTEGPRQPRGEHRGIAALAIPAQTAGQRAFTPRSPRSASRDPCVIPPSRVPEAKRRTLLTKMETRTFPVPYCIHEDVHARCPPVSGAKFMQPCCISRHPFDILATRPACGLSLGIAGGLRFRGVGTGSEPRGPPPSRGRGRRAGSSCHSGKGCLKPASCFRCVLSSCWQAQGSSPLAIATRGTPMGRMRAIAPSAPSRTTSPPCSSP